MRAKRVKIRIRRLPESTGLPLPVPASPGSSGVDLLAAIGTDVKIRPGDSALIPTGICVEIPAGLEAQVRPRSGLALHHGVTVLNSPGTIDSDYRGEVGVILINHGNDVFTVCRGDRIGQLVFCPVCEPVFEEVDSLRDTGRGPGGFGHTGL
jgi:dUTP pyrophosphatase